MSREYDPTNGDIVKQLRNWEGDYHYPSGLLDAAAEEIERLRIKVITLIKGYHSTLIGG